MLKLLKSYPHFNLNCVKRNYNNVYIKSTAELGNNTSYTFESGRLARFADGAVVISQGENALLSTVVQGKTASDFGALALTAEYRHSGAAVGKIPNILTARCVDRSLRPLFMASYKLPVQVICKPLALDDDCDTVVLSINASSASVYCANLPLIAPVGAVRVALVNDEIIINPKKYEKKKSTLDLLLAGTKDEKVIMLEMEGKEVPIEVFQRCVKEGLNSIQKIIESIEKLNPNFELHDPATFEMSELDRNIQNSIRDLAENELVFIFTDITLDKEGRDNKIKNVLKNILNDLSREYNIPESSEDISRNFSAVVKEILRNETIRSNIRIDGRKLNEIRPISMEVDVYKKLHGSALFQRGQSQVLSTVTFDSPESAFRPDSISQLIGEQEEKKFMHHYEFPSFAVNEIKQTSRQNRREIGHGILAEKALKNMIPSDFPFSIRLNTQVLESNGSTSMAAVVGGTLALRDAGVVLKSPVAGIAMGLMSSDYSSESKEKVILTDLNGIEDYAGDMDFKIAGTREGFTAMQLDVKIPGLSLDLLNQSLQNSREGLNFILDKINATQPHARSEFKKTVPVIEIINVQMKTKIALLQNGGYNLKLVETETNTKIKFEDDLSLRIFAPTIEKMNAAKEMISNLKDSEKFVQLDFGGLYDAEIVEILKSGFMIKFTKGTKPVFIKNSDIAGGRSKVVDSALFNKNVGDKIKVKYYGEDPNTGKMRLSCIMLDVK
uniref:Polyribonucleotide nucleotidyltransferase n=1 Tax=Strongyloides stercoralis TaxID=6248 RepID=A0A0K0E021_STRER